MEQEHVFIDVKTCTLSLTEVMQEIERIQAEYPEYEIFMDGDRYAIVGRRRNARWPAGSPLGCTTPMTRTSGSPIAE